MVGVHLRQARQFLVARIDLVPQVVGLGQVSRKDVNFLSQGKPPDIVFAQGMMGTCLVHCQYGGVQFGLCSFRLPFSLLAGIGQPRLFGLSRGEVVLQGGDFRAEIFDGLIGIVQG